MGFEFKLPNNFDRNLDKNNTRKIQNETNFKKNVRYALNLTTASSGSGVVASRKNTYLKQ